MKILLNLVYDTQNTNDPTDKLQMELLDTGDVEIAMTWDNCVGRRVQVDRNKFLKAVKLICED